MLFNVPKGRMKIKRSCARKVCVNSTVNDGVILIPRDERKKGVGNFFLY